MLTDFFFHLRHRGLPISTREYLTLLEALKAGVIGPSIDEFYHLSRATLVKDEAKFDRFDFAFGEYFRGVLAKVPDLARALPEDWLKKLIEKTLTPEEKAKLDAMDWQTLMDTLKKRLEEQEKRHQGGNKWIGTGGTSPFGAFGDNPAGIRIGQDKSRQRSAVKVWDQRAYRDYDDNVELNTRTIKVALRRLRKFARTGAEDELDIDGTLTDTVRDGGVLNIRMRPERRNAIKLVLLLDVGGSMDDHIRVVEELFSAAKSEFKYLKHYYFHNCVYDHVWTSNNRRHSDRTKTWDLINKFGADTRLVFVGDAAMSPYEIVQPGGSIEYTNDEAGSVWMQRLTQHFKRAVWINPEPRRAWSYRQSSEILFELMDGRMEEMTLDGLTTAMRVLAK
jgi:uncharacterized protein